MSLKKVKALWDFSVKGKRDIRSRPALLTPQGVISVFTYGFENSGSVFQLHDLASGTVQWQQDLPGTANRFALHGASHFYFPMLQGSGHYYDLDGNLLAEYRVGKSNIWAMLPSGDHEVIVNEIHGSASAIECIDVTSGESLWRTALAEAVKTPVNKDGVYYCSTITCVGDPFGSDAPYRFLVHAVDEITGVVLWEQEISHYPLSSVIDGDRLFIGSREAVVVLNRSSGQVEQVLDLSHDSDSIYQMIAADGRLFTLSDAGYLSLFDLNTLTLIASEPLLEGKGQLAVRGDCVYLQNANGNVFEYDRATLSPQREFFVRKAKEASPSLALAGDYLFVNSKSTFYCFDLS